MMEQNPVIAASVVKIRGQIDIFAEVFYASLYARAPHLRQHLNGSEAERRKLGAMMAVLGNMREVERVLPALRKMGERHAGYGVVVSDYPLLVAAFLDAVQVVDPERGEAGRTAWRQLFGDIVMVMSEGQQHMPQAVRTSRHDAVLLPPGSASLYEDVGGQAVVERVHKRFYDTIFADEWLGGFFAAKSKESLVLKQTRFMVAAFGGPDEYIWESPAMVHMHMMVTGEQADIREVLLRNAIRAEGLPQDVEDRWLATDQAFRPAVVKQSVDECVMRCPGQVAVVVRRPPGYRLPVLLPRGQVA